MCTVRQGAVQTQSTMPSTPVLQLLSNLAQTLIFPTLSSQGYEYLGAEANAFVPSKTAV
jgi:hypothetical protein